VLTLSWSKFTCQLILVSYFKPSIFIAESKRNGIIIMMCMWKMNGMILQKKNYCWPFAQLVMLYMLKVFAAALVY
jgi:hypothetical protein